MDVYTDDVRKVHVDYEDGLHYAQWVLMRLYNIDDCSYEKWKQARKYKPPIKQQSFWLEHIGPDQRLSPVYGVRDKE